MATVRDVSSNTTATAVPQGDLLPEVGDQATIFFKMAGLDDEVSVATGTVRMIEGDLITIAISNSTGDVLKDQLVRITSERPQQRGTPAVATTREDPDDVPNSFNEGQSVIEARSPPPQLSPTPTPRATPTRNTPRFAGRWQVQNENANYTLSLSQKGNRVTGTYNLQGGSLTGIIRGNTLVATWRQPGNRRGGSARLRVSGDGKTLSGPWDYDPATYSSGLTGSGVWTFRRERGSP